MNKLIVDRFEGNYAICEREDKSMIHVPKYKLPLRCKEGDVLIKNSDGMYQPDTDASALKEKRIREKLNRLLDK
jgi:hypothetical protein